MADERVAATAYAAYVRNTALREEAAQLVWEIAHPTGRYWEYRKGLRLALLGKQLHDDALLVRGLAFFGQCLERQ
jgi:hypothetical protein